MEFQVWDRMKREGSGIWNSFVDLLYPKVCEVCGRSLVRGEKYLCTACIADFPFTDATYVTSEDILSQFETHYRPEKLYALFYYNKFSNYKNLIYLIKYNSYRQLGIYLGQMLGERIASDCRADCIVPIPLHKKREKERGFNQALEIACGINRATGIEVMADVVMRVQNNVSQTGKNAAERLKNVENIFQLQNASCIQGRHVLLVDDVITTGATIGSCLRVLAEAGDVKFSLGCLAQTV